MYAQGEVASLPSAMGLPYEFARGVTRRQIFSDGAVEVFFVEGRAGCSVPPHSHPQYQGVFVVSGAIRSNVGGTESYLAAGATTAIPAHTVHSYSFEEDSILIFVFRPPITEAETHP